MVDVAGHIAMGMLWAIPAWFLWDEQTSLGFIAIVALAALLPDIDLWIEKVLPAVVHHHGVTHTVVFVVAFGFVVAGIVATTLTGFIDQRVDSEHFSSSSLFMFVFGGIVLGGFSHLFADILSAPDIAQPIEPFWPVYNQPVIVDVIWYNSPVWNIGLLTVAVLLHLAIAYAVKPYEHSYRIQ